MSFLQSINVAASGLTAERTRIDLISENIANANVTRTAAGTPYRRKMAVFRAQRGDAFENFLSIATGKTVMRGVEVAAIVEDQSAFKRVFKPTHPDADKDGFVHMPNVNVVNEMINMISATRAYESNIASIRSTKSMAMKAIEIGR